jgi:hypothetical protein
MYNHVTILHSAASIALHNTARTGNQPRKNPRNHARVAVKTNASTSSIRRFRRVSGREAPGSTRCDSFSLAGHRLCVCNCAVDFQLRPAKPGDVCVVMTVLDLPLTFTHNAYPAHACKLMTMPMLCRCRAGTRRGSHRECRSVKTMSTMS